MSIMAAIDQLEALLQQPTFSIALQLSSDQLRAWLTTWKPSRSVLAFTNITIPSGWHTLGDQLTEQEQAGLITTGLTVALHHLLLNSPKQYFLLPATSSDIAVPDRSAYLRSVLSLTVKEQIDSQHELINQLVKSGWRRHRTSLEPGTFRVRGEQIDVSHPVFTGYYTITLYQNNIESIVHQEGNRSRVVDRLVVPPMSFPAQTTPLSSIVKDFLVIRPGFLASLKTDHEIIYDAPIPDIEFPMVPSTVPAVASEQKPVSLERASELLAQLTIGRAAVHADHGVGIYEGLQERIIGGVAKDYLILRYAEGDTISVPIEYAYKVTAYVGEKHPLIHRLGGTLWLATKRKAQHDAAAFAKELITIASARHKRTRPPYVISSDIETMLEKSFPYELTPDQERSWHEIRQDLQHDEPMDRLVVGDVGFGKTELAQRAAAHVVASGKQVAIVAPTTLLAQQHTDTFQQRFKELSFQVDQLSRFVSVKQKNKTIQDIASGKVNIVIGTHALLSKKIIWKDLGLVIIDEEQRFGVKQKEHFKKLRSEVDLLSLSATPIPRTLSMAMSGLRQLSVMMTAPTGRKSVETLVKPQTDEVLLKALTTELSRKGQAYVVLPRIHGLSSIAHHISELIPGVRIAVAHGQMPEDQLAAIIHQFDSGQLDILVSSTIVENGLDLPNANTMIILDAPSYGLSDLYQLRGRIGRRERQGYAYLLYNQHELTSVQRERLTAMTEASRLGAGWEVARRDLEIRGAGNMLGAEQSGSVAGVGLQLYFDLVRTASDHQHATSNERPDITLALPFPTLLPPSYIADLAQRTRWYTRLSRATSMATLQDYKLELGNFFGAAPEETQNLFTLLYFQLSAGQAGITKIYSKTINRPDSNPFERLFIDGKDVRGLVQKLSATLEITVRDTSITIDTPEITVALLEQLTKALGF